MSGADTDSQVLKTPEWLEVLENKRKRPYKLAHEIGAGAPCLVCKDGCKGLNLHFWRKLCIECKCRKEDHEVQEEEDYAQFEILFGAKKVKRTTIKFNAQNKSFDWIPPNVTPELAVDYLKSIPQSKLPISNTEGAKYRKQQLEKQLPLHDVDPNACHNLSDKEVKEFEKYLDNLKSNVIGQGRILKYQSPKALKENYIQYSSPNMTASSEKYSDLKLQGAELRGHVSVNKVPFQIASSQGLDTESYPAQSFLDSKLHNYSHPISSSKTLPQSLRNTSLEQNQNTGLKSHNLNFSIPKPYLSTSNILKDPQGGTLESMKNDQRSNLGLKTPSSFLNKKYPPNDRQNNNEFPHRDDNCNENAGEEPIGGSYPHNCQPANSNFSEKGAKRGLNESGNIFPTAPCDASVCKVPLEEFNEMNLSSSEVPYAVVQESKNINAPNKFAHKDEKLPAQPEELSELFPTPPATCQQCLEILYPEEVVVQTERGGNSALWHAKCFVCETCKELLVDLMYFFNKGKVYCGRHYAEIMKIPRCYACDELIFVKEYTCAEGESYHVRHFCCFHCDQPLGGKQYIPKDNQPVCLDCFQAKFGKTCRTCGQAIAPGDQRVSWKHLDFHVNPQCFRCSKCLKSLLGGRFVVKNENTFCSKECAQDMIN